MCRFLTNPFPEPPVRIPSVLFVLTKALAIEFIVPSPPKAVNISK